MTRELIVVTDHSDIIGIYTDEDEAVKDFLQLDDTGLTTYSYADNCTATANNGETKFFRIYCNDQVEKTRPISIAQ